MKFALFVACAALVEAQSCSLYNNDSSSCTENNCTFFSFNTSCTYNPNGNASYCDTSSKTCGANCTAGPRITNLKTCSTCTNTCPSKSETECNASAGRCNWAIGFAFCLSSGAPARCITATSESACTAEENCFWANISVNVCGQAWPERPTHCLPCDYLFNNADRRSGLKNLVGHTCTHAKAGDFDSDFSYTINGYSQHAQCNNLTSPRDPMDRESVSAFIQASFPRGEYFDAASEIPTCVAAPTTSAPTSAPSIAPTSSTNLSTSAPTAVTVDTTNDASSMLPSAALLLLAASLLA